jgi:hypothetical protein
VWGDHRPEDNTFVQQSRLCAKLINKYGGNASVLKLGAEPVIQGGLVRQRRGPLDFAGGRASGAEEGNRWTPFTGVLGVP